MDSIHLERELARISEHWSPRVIGEVNGSQIKLAKLKGEFTWHRHEKEDELFLILKGNLVIRLRDREVALAPGEMFIVPRDTEHQPVATEEVHVMLFEPASTVRTGD